MKTFIWIIKRLGILLAAVFVTVAIGSVISSNRVINSLNGLGAESNFADRLSMSFYDLTHFGSLYGIFIFLALSIAFAAAWGVFKLTGFGRIVVYIIAGATAIFVMLWAMEQVFFGVPIVAGARDTSGLLFQMMAGGVGGFIFARMSAPKPALKS